MAVRLSDQVIDVLDVASKWAVDVRSEYITPEHLMKGMLAQTEFCRVFKRCSGSKSEDTSELDNYIMTNSTKTLVRNGKPENSFQMGDIMEEASRIVVESGAEELSIPHLIYALLNIQNSYAKYWLTKTLSISSAEFLSEVFDAYSTDIGTEPTPKRQDEIWKRFLTKIEGRYYIDNPIVGRESEIARAIMIMCRKEKNNILLVGEHGVGKNAIVGGIAARLSGNDMPKRLRGRSVYMLDMSAIISGTQFRGDMEKRLKDTMDGVITDNNVIVFVDNIHDIVGAGRGVDSTLDASSILLPYMQNQNVIFIGATTFDDYKKSISRSRILAQMFQKIDVSEPSPSEAVEILEGIRDKFESFHHVMYNDDVIKYAVDSSVRYIQGRFLPEKAIDLIDEAGSYREMHPTNGSVQVVDKKLVAEILSKICHIDLTEKEDKNILDIKKTLYSKIYGQNQAVDAVCQAVFTSKAGLADPEKPMATFLFVGPTGVGKTQLARELASGLSIPLQRFDMSEYSEKYTVSKFIGAPAGYVGYDDGGILTDTVRKTPHCVLLLDEIEKAHQDIYNLLLQVMDYGTLSDAKGQKIDFRNTIIIMTSNAGARYAKQAAVGFGNIANSSAAMNKEVRSVFAPEFINRLSSTVLFNDMTKEMARLIAESKLNDLRKLVALKGIHVTFSSNATEHIVDLGFSPEYGAREIERTITKSIKPLLVDKILFDGLASGDNAFIDYENDRFTITQTV